jgi:hypothetical protein
MSQEKKRILIYPKLHNYDGDVLEYNPIELNLYPEYIEVNIDFLFKNIEVFENDLTGIEKEMDVEESLWVKTIIPRGTFSVDALIISKLEIDEEKTYKEYTIQLRNTGIIYTFKLKSKALMLTVYELLKKWYIGGYNELEDYYELGKV